MEDQNNYIEIAGDDFHGNYDDVIETVDQSGNILDTVDGPNQQAEPEPQGYTNPNQDSYQQ